MAAPIISTEAPEVKGLGVTWEQTDHGAEARLDPVEVIRLVVRLLEPVVAWQLAKVMGDERDDGHVYGHVECARGHAAHALMLLDPDAPPVCIGSYICAACAPRAYPALFAGPMPARAVPSFDEFLSRVVSDCIEGAPLAENTAGMEGAGAAWGSGANADGEAF